MRECEIIIIDYKNNYRYFICVKLNYIQLKLILNSVDLNSNINIQYTDIWIYLSFDSINFPRLLTSLLKYKILWIHKDTFQPGKKCKKLPIIKYYLPNYNPLQTLHTSIMLLNQSIFRPFMDF